MGKWTTIPWADRTANGQMGCAGCELSKRRGRGTCYAEHLTERAGPAHVGYPPDFYVPKLFLKRYDELLTMPDLVGYERPKKSWLNELPQVIFHNDMGDAFSPGLELDWWHGYAERFARMRALHIWLTKWPSRMRRSFELLGYVPTNFLLGTSLTSAKTDRRAVELLRIKGARRWLSIEPDVDGVDVRHAWGDAGDGLIPFEWAVYGGESGGGAAPYFAEWAQNAIAAGRELGIRTFLKQFGSNPHFSKDVELGFGGMRTRYGWAEHVTFPQGCRIRLKDRKGENWNEWPERYRVRQMPLHADQAVPA